MSNEFRVLSFSAIPVMSSDGVTTRSLTLTSGSERVCSHSTLPSPERRVTSPPLAGSFPPRTHPSRYGTVVGGVVHRPMVKVSFPHHGSFVEVEPERVNWNFGRSPHVPDDYGT